MTTAAETAEQLGLTESGNGGFTGFCPSSAGSTSRARTVKQFCADYGVGKTLTYAEIKAGRLRAVKVSFKTLILQEDSEAWVRSLPEVTP